MLFHCAYLKLIQIIYYGNECKNKGRYRVFYDEEYGDAQQAVSYANRQSPEIRIFAYFSVDG